MAIDIGTRKTLIGIFEKMSQEQIDEAYDMLRAEWSIRQQRKAMEFSKGDMVSFSDRHGHLMKGVVIGVNRKSVSVDCTGMRWKVAPSLLEKAQ